MINNEFLLNINSKEITQKTNKDITNNKSDVNNDFKKILKEKSEKIIKSDSRRNNDLDNKEIINNNETKSSEIENDEIKVENSSSFEEAIKEVVNIITNEENFQGNNMDSSEMEELVAILNQIINLPEFKSLLPVKLEDPMLISNSINNSTENNSININKEAFNLANTILETLNSENITKVLSQNELSGFKVALELLSNNLLNQDANLISNNIIVPEKINKKNTEIKNIEIDESNVNAVKDLDEGEIKGILTEVKSKLNSDEASDVEMSEYGTNSEASKEETIITEDDRVLAKILGESEATALNKQSTLINRLNIKGAEVIKEPMVVNKETMDADIIKNVKFMMKNAVSELKVKIYPKELGEMTIKLLSEEGILKADIKAKSKETYNLLNTNLNDIKKSLEQQNIKIQEVNISLYSDDTTYYSGENPRDEMSENNGNRQGENSSKESVYIIDDLETDEKLGEDSSINQLV